MLVAIAGGGYYAYTTYFQKAAEPAVAAAPSATPAPAPVPNTGAARKSVREAVDEYLATKPTPEAMLAKARDYAKADDMAAAFLVFRRAAETGNPAAQLELATFYDPLATPARGGFTPDGARAADWYERAALAGNARRSASSACCWPRAVRACRPTRPRPRPGCSRRRRRTTPTPRRRWTPCRSSEDAQRP